MYCSNCGTQVQNQDRYCNSCGVSLERDKLLGMQTNGTMAVQVAHGYGSSKSKSILTNKIFLLVSAAVVVIAGVLIYLGFTGNERMAISAAKDRIMKEGKAQGASVVSFYDLKTQLVQREDRELRKSGSYRITGGFEFKDPNTGKSGYRLFSIYVNFAKGSFSASSPSFQTDYDKYKK